MKNRVKNSRRLACAYTVSFYEDGGLLGVKDSDLIKMIKAYAACNGTSFSVALKILAIKQLRGVENGNTGGDSGEDFNESMAGVPGSSEG